MLLPHEAIHRRAADLRDPNCSMTLDDLRSETQVVGTLEEFLDEEVEGARSAANLPLGLRSHSSSTRASAASIASSAPMQAAAPARAASYGRSSLPQPV